MAARDERRAVLVLALLAAAGGVVRVAGSSGGPPGAPLVAPELPGQDVARQAAASLRAEALQRPLRPGERVDVDRAGAEELARLPRVGAKLARRIVEEREAHGPFGSLDGLRRVSGIGPAMRAALERSVTFSGTAIIVPCPDQTPAPAPAAARPAREAAGKAPCASGVVPLNTASARDLECLRGVGPALAARIVADRTARGPFASVDDLDRVPGVGKRLVERLRPSVRAP